MFLWLVPYCYYFFDKNPQLNGICISAADFSLFQYLPCHVRFYFSFSVLRCVCVFFSSLLLVDCIRYIRCIHYQTVIACFFFLPSDISSLVEPRLRRHFISFTLLFSWRIIHSSWLRPHSCVFIPSKCISIAEGAKKRTAKVFCHHASGAAFVLYTKSRVFIPFCAKERERFHKRWHSEILVLLKRKLALRIVYRGNVSYTLCLL